MKVIKSLENRGILLKGTSRRITSQEGGFLSFLVFTYICIYFNIIKTF